MIKRKKNKTYKLLFLSLLILFLVALVTAFIFYKNRQLIPKVKIVRGKELNLRHFQTGLEPVYPN